MLDALIVALRTIPNVGLYALHADLTEAQANKVVADYLACLPGMLRSLLVVTNSCMRLSTRTMHVGTRPHWGTCFPKLTQNSLPETHQAASAGSPRKAPPLVRLLKAPLDP